MTDFFYLLRNRTLHTLTDDIFSEGFNRFLSEPILGGFFVSGLFPNNHKLRRLASVSLLPIIFFSFLCGILAGRRGQRGRERLRENVVNPLRPQVAIPSSALLFVSLAAFAVQHVLTTSQASTNSLIARISGNRSEHETINKVIRFRKLIEEVTRIIEVPGRESAHSSATHYRTPSFFNDMHSDHHSLADLRFNAWPTNLSCDAPLPTKATTTVLGLRIDVKSSFVRVLASSARNAGQSKRYLFRIFVSIRNEGEFIVQLLTLERRIASQHRGTSHPLRGFTHSSLEPIGLGPHKESILEPKGEGLDLTFHIVLPAARSAYHGSLQFQVLQSPYTKKSTYAFLLSDFISSLWNSNGDDDDDDDDGDSDRVTTATERILSKIADEKDLFSELHSINNTFSPLSRSRKRIFGAELQAGDWLSIPIDRVAMVRPIQVNGEQTKGSHRKSEGDSSKNEEAETVRGKCFSDEEVFGLRDYQNLKARAKDSATRVAPFLLEDESKRKPSERKKATSNIEEELIRAERNRWERTRETTGIAMGGRVIVSASLRSIQIVDELVLVIDNEEDDEKKEARGDTKESVSSENEFKGHSGIEVNHSAQQQAQNTERGSINNKKGRTLAAEFNVKSAAVCEGSCHVLSCRGQKLVPSLANLPPSARSRHLQQSQSEDASAEGESSSSSRFSSRGSGNSDSFGPQPKPVLHVLSASLGRTSRNVCRMDNAMSRVDCERDVTAAVRTACQGRDHCELCEGSTTGVGGDPFFCENTYKYVNVSIACVPPHVANTYSTSRIDENLEFREPYTTDSKELDGPNIPVFPSVQEVAQPLSLPLNRQRFETRRRYVYDLFLQISNARASGFVKVVSHRLVFKEEKKSKEDGHVVGEELQQHVVTGKGIGGNNKYDGIEPHFKQGDVKEDGIGIFVPADSYMSTIQTDFHHIKLPFQSGVLDIEITLEEADSAAATGTILHAAAASASSSELSLAWDAAAAADPFSSEHPVAGSYSPGDQVRRKYLQQRSTAIGSLQQGSVRDSQSADESPQHLEARAVVEYVRESIGDMLKICEDHLSAFENRVDGIDATTYEAKSGFKDMFRRSRRKIISLWRYFGASSCRRSRHLWQQAWPPMNSQHTVDRALEEVVAEAAALDKEWDNRTWGRTFRVIVSGIGVKMHSEQS